jgi:hypothetical protein
MGWESDRSVPELSNAMELEKITEGDVRIEDWGYEREVGMMREVIERRITDKPLPTEAA